MTPDPLTLLDTLIGELEADPLNGLLLTEPTEAKLNDAVKARGLHDHVLRREVADVDSLNPDCVYEAIHVYDPMTEVDQFCGNLIRHNGPEQLDEHDPDPGVRVHIESQKFTHEHAVKTLKRWRAYLASAPATAEPSTEDQPQAVEADPAKPKELKPSRKLAYGQYLAAEKDWLDENPNEPLKDDVAYTMAKDALEPGDKPLPKLPVWKRYLRECREFHGTQKNSPVAGRPHGGSIVKEADR